MKFVIIFNNRLPTERAHGLQVVKMCEALADAGAEVRLIIPKVANQIKEDIFSYYKIKNNFFLKKKWCLDLNGWITGEALVYRIKYLTFLLGLLTERIDKDSLIFTRHPEVAFLFSWRGWRVIYELHNWLEQSRRKTLFLIKKVFFIIVTLNSIKEEFIKNGFKAEKILVAPNGVDLKDLKLSIGKRELRMKQGLPPEKIIILYSGHLYEKKGVYTIAYAVPYLPAERYEIVFVGGLSDDVRRLKEATSHYRNIRVLGAKKSAEIPTYLLAADILVIANSAKDVVEKNFTAPLKLFEYLATGRVIVASDVPALREFLDENVAVLVEPDNPQKLAEAIKEIDGNAAKQRLLINNSLKLAQNFTWEKRAHQIIDFIQNHESY